jgi:hypothetical protein
MCSAELLEATYGKINDSNFAFVKHSLSTTLINDLCDATLGSSPI